MAASLGEAYINIKASTKGFAADLSKQLKTVLAQAQKDADGAFKNIAKSAAKAADDTAKSAQASAKSRVVSAEAAEAKIRAVAKAEFAAYREADARKAESAKAADADRVASAAAAQKAIDEITKAETAAYKEAAARRAEAARAADKAIAESARATARAQRLAISNAFARADIAKAQTDSLKSSIGGIGSALGSVGSNIFDGIATSAKFATVGVIALGVALTGIGLQSAAALQNTKIAFGALANEIVNGDTAVQEFGVAASKAIGDKFTQDLRSLALQSSLAFTTLSSVSQQLLSLGFNGEQTKSVIIDVGNALAASGKTGGQLNEDLRGIFTAFSQIKGAGRLLAQDLNQITTRIPAATRVKVYNQLAKDLGLAAKNAKSASPELAKARKEVIKLAENGKISSDVALASLDKVFKAISGAGKDSAGLNALQRTNLSLSGQFEQFKETIRNSLADIFSPITEGLAKKLTGATDKVQKALKSNADSLKNFALSFADTLIALIDPLGHAISSVFNVLGAAIDAIGPKLPALFAGFAAAFDAIGNIAKGDIGKRLGDLFASLGRAVPVVVDALKSAAPAFAVVAGVALDLVGIVLGLAPALKGVADVLGVIGQILSPLVLLLDAVKYAIDIIPPGLLESIGAVVAILATFVGIVTAVSLVGPAVVAALGAITVGVDALTIALLANPLGLAIAATAALGIALVLLARRFEPVRIALTTGMELIARLFTGQVDIILFAIQGLFKAFDSVGGFLGKVIPGLGGLADKAGAAADSIGNLRSSMDQAVGSISELGTSAATTGSTVFATAGNIGIFNDAVRGTSIAMLDAGVSAATLQGAINALPTEKRIAVEVAIFTTIGKSNTDFLKSKGINATGLEDATGFSTEGIQSAAASVQKKITDANNDFLNGIQKAIKSAGGATAGIGGSKGAGSKAAQNAADSFAKKIQDILDSLDKEFRDTLVTGTAKQIDTALDSLRKKIRDAFLAAKKPPPSKLLAAIENDNTRLKTLANERDKIIDKLKLATDRAKQVADGVKDFASITNLGLQEIAKAAEEAKTKLADLSRLRIILPGQDALNTLIGGSPAEKLKADAQKFSDELAKRLATVREFQANIKKLIAAGLNKTSIDQIISAGADSGGSVAETLAGASAATIKQINATQAAIQKAGTDLGNTAADSLFRSGKNVVDGLIAGLTERRDEIKKAMKTIADDLVEEIRKDLKIKSPSRVMLAIGQFAGKGLENGLLNSRPAITAAAGSLAAASVPRFQNISALQLSAMANAQSGFGRPAALGSTTTHNREVNAPINQTFHVSPGVDAKTLGDSIGRGIVGRLR